MKRARRFSDTFFQNKINKQEPWSRPQPEPIVCKESDFFMQHVDTTYAVVGERREPEIRLWGCTEQGNSVLVRVIGFEPYFFVQLDPSLDPNIVFSNLNKYLTKLLQDNKKERVDGPYVKRYMVCDRMSIMGWSKNQTTHAMYRVTMALPSHVNKARKALEYGNKNVCPNTMNPTYEANTPFVLRYMVDKELGGCQWIKLEKGKYELTTLYTTRVQYDWTVTWTNVFPVNMNDALGSSIAPMRILSFDIEALKRGRGFPDPKEDSCITICCALEEVNRGIVDKLALTTVPNPDTDGCTPIDGVRTIVCESERDMLLAFAQYVVECDPDIFTGYNIDGFDFPYLRERSKQLYIYDQYTDMSRMETDHAYLKVTNFQSKAYGARTSYEWVCEGRFSYDCLVFMLRGQMRKLRSYKLNAVAKVFLGDEKVDVSYDQIPILYDGTDEDRSRLVVYCSKDAILPLDLLRQQMAIVNAVEQGRVTGVPIKWLLSRGQQIKTFSNILRYKNEVQVIPTTSAEQNEDHTAGGAVEDPKRGYYVPGIPNRNTQGYGTVGLIGTLDFASLYPSIMVGYNVCYSTKTSLSHAFYNLNENDYWIHPFFESNMKQAFTLRKQNQPVPKKLLHGYAFVKQHVREGVLPRMLRILLATRSNVKKLMWWENVAAGLVQQCLEKKPMDVEKMDEKQRQFVQSLQHLSVEQLRQKYKEHKVRYSVFDGRQLAVKIVCNSVYGFLKANMVTDKDLMSAVTGWGRWMIGVSKEIAESHFTRANGYEHDAYVVYGDTDSIMVNFGDVSLQRCKQLSEECSAMCTQRFVKPNLLEFETIKISSLFINKKRYAAIEVEKIGPNESIEQALARGKLTLKGLESKRRDNSPIASKTQARVIELLLRELNVQGAEDFIRETCTNVLLDRVDMSQYVITKGLSKTEKQYAKGGTKQQHVELAKRIKQRAKETGEMPPSTGDRVPYVMIQGAKNSKAFERAEDPLFALKNKIPLDKDHYIEKIMYAILRPMTAVYEPHRCLEIKSNMTEKVIRTFVAVQKLFQGPHMRVRVNKSGGNVGIARFARVLPKCIGCGIQVAASMTAGAVCRTCAPQLPLLYMKYQEQANVLQAKHKDYWTECQECVGSHMNPVTCANFDCHNFFRRTKVIMDLEDLDKILQRFQTL